MGFLKAKHSSESLTPVPPVFFPVSAGGGGVKHHYPHVTSGESEVWKLANLPKIRAEEKQISTLAC